MTSRTDRLPALVWLGVLAAVAAYFAIGATRTLEYLDEGQILYPSWLVAQGAVPYEDFHHLYGPAVFAVNGALLRWFGADVLVVRISLVLLKTLAVALTYLVTRHVASRPFALLTGAVLTAVWGTPWWVFNTPYANHYSLTLTLAGLLVFLSLPKHFAASCLVAGLCFGVAAAFKQTAGVFAASGFVLFLILDRDGPERSDLPADAPAPGWGVRAARLAALGGMLGFFAVYLSPRNTAWNVLMLAAPAAATILVAAGRELSGSSDGGTRSGLVGIAYAALGAAIPAVGLAAFYGARGSLGALVFDLVRGLPQMFTWFDPLPLPTQPTLVLVAIIAAVLASFVTARWGLTALGAVAAAAAVMIAVGPGSQMDEYLRSRIWQGPIVRVWALLPFIALWLAFLDLFRAAPGSGHPAGQRRALLLVYCNAVTSALLFYPSADWFHIYMSLPAFVPLFGYLLERFYRSASRGRAGSSTLRRWAAAGVVGGLAAMMAAPLVDHLASAYAVTRDDPTALRRATAIRGSEPKFGEVAALVAYLDSHVPPDAPLLVLSCEQMVYFLAHRRSALEKDEFVFYLVGADIISDEDARRVVDQGEVTTVLATARPLVVEGGERRTDGRVRRVFDELSRYLDAHYEVVATVGGYRILRWAR